MTIITGGWDLHIMKRKMGLLVMAYGTPYKEDDIERYYTHIRRGENQLQKCWKICERYKAIGGSSPLAKITLEQAKKLEEHLNAIQDEL